MYQCIYQSTQCLSVLTVDSKWVWSEACLDMAGGQGMICTSRTWSSEWEDMLGVSNWTSCKMHLEMGLVNVWRFTWRLWLGVTGGSIETQFQMHFDMVSEWKWRYSLTYTERQSIWRQLIGRQLIGRQLMQRCLIGRWSITGWSIQR